MEHLNQKDTTVTSNVTDNSENCTSDQIMQFLHNQNVNRISAMPINPKLLDYGAGTRDAMGDYLSRWTLINTFDFTQASPIEFDPWNLFFNDPNIFEKISRFYMIKGQLCIKVVFTGNVRHFGGAFLSYVPFTDVSTSNDTDDNVATLESQRSIFAIMNACSTDPILMHLPMINTGTHYKLVSGNSIVNPMGTLRYRTVADAKTIGIAGFTPNISVRIYARLMEGYELSGPLNLVPQSGEMSDDAEEVSAKTMEDDGNDKAEKGEYGGVISRPAHVLSNIAGLMSTVPYIGEFALPVSMASSALAEVASIFGYSNPSSIDLPSHMKRQPFENMAFSAGVSSSNKLTLDPKATLSVDNRTSGGTGVDEMSFAHVLGIRSYIGSFTWSTAGNVGSELFSLSVDPAAMITKNVAENRIYMSSVAHVSQLFKYWTGTLEFTIVFLCSKLHRGMYRVSYTPMVNLTAGANTGKANANYTSILDLSESNSITFRIKWSQPQAFLPVRSVAEDDTVTRNGSFKVLVENQLQTSSDITEEITGLVFVKGGDDLSFAAPTNINISQYQWDIESGETECSEIDSLGNNFRAEMDNSDRSPFTNTPTDNTSGDVFTLVPTRGSVDYRNNFGDAILSLKAICNRFDIWGYLSPNMDYTSSLIVPTSRINFIYSASFPLLHPGPDADNNISGGEGEVGDPDNPTSTSTLGHELQMNILNYVVYAYATYRGSLKAKVNLLGGHVDGSAVDVVTPLSRIAVKRVERSFAQGTSFLAYDPTPGQFAATLRNAGDFQVDGAASGIMLTNKDQNAMEFEVPNYSPYNFSPIRANIGDIGTTNATGGAQGAPRVNHNDSTPCINVTALMHIDRGQINGKNFVSPGFQVFVAAGDDLCCSYYMGPPPLVVPSPLVKKDHD